MTFGQHLRGMRHGAGLSQGDLARASGLHRTHISLIERWSQGRGMTLETLVRLSAGLDIAPGTLLDTYIVSDDRPAT
jgi:transcriptional regulator with XRE-family HTH domain